MGWAIEELAALFVELSVSRRQPVSRLHSQQMTPKHLRMLARALELCEPVDDAGEVNSSICARITKVCMSWSLTRRLRRDRRVIRLLALTFLQSGMYLFLAFLLVEVNLLVTYL